MSAYKLPDFEMHTACFCLIISAGIVSFLSLPRASQWTTYTIKIGNGVYCSGHLAAGQDEAEINVGLTASEGRCDRGPGLTVPVALSSVAPAEIREGVTDLHMLSIGGFIVKTQHIHTWSIKDFSPS